MKIRCPGCDGSGVWPRHTESTYLPPCKCCGGTGVQIVADPSPHVFQPILPQPFAPFGPEWPADPPYRVTCQ